jgi:hypothetical protein
MAESVDVPELFSQRRGEFMSGLNRKTIAAKLPLHGVYNQIARTDLEGLIGRRLTAQDWDRATVAINRAGLEEREVA